MKCLVKPVTPFMLLLSHGEVVEASRPSLVTVDSFVNSRVASGMLILLAPNVPDTATDDEFRKFWRESDRDETLAVDSFMSQFTTKVEKEAPPPPPVDTPVDTPADPAEAPRAAKRK